MNSDHFEFIYAMTCTSDLKTHEYRCKDHSQILPHQNCREIQLAHSPSRIVLFPSIEHPVFNLVQTYSDQGRFQIQILKKSLKSLTTTESDIFFVCDIDLKIDTKTLDRIRMNTGDNKVYFPMFFRLVDYTVQYIHHWEAPKPCKNGSIGFIKSNVNHEVIISLELQEFQNKMDSGERFRSECQPWIRYRILYDSYIVSNLEKCQKFDATISSDQNSILNKGGGRRQYRHLVSGALEIKKFKKRISISRASDP